MGLRRCSPADARLECMAVPQILAHKWGGGGGPPPGGVNGLNEKTMLKKAKQIAKKLPRQTCLSKEQET